MPEIDLRFQSAFEKLSENLKGYAEPGTVKSSYDLMQVILYEILGHLKFFDHQLNDNDDANYYMEREWRVLQDVDFKLSDVYRVILPEEYAGRFRRDFADYSSQITFADQLT